jgi:prepilin-type N-terminal cleavage/methylation domain-containing protein
MEINMFKNINKGFTLVELTIALGVFSIIVGVGGDILTTIIRAYQRAEQFSLVEREGNNALTLIEQDIRRSVKVELLDALGNPTTSSSSNFIRLTIPTGTGGSYVTRIYSFYECGLPNEGIYLDTGNLVTTGSSPDLFQNKVNVKYYNSSEVFTHFKEGGFETVYVTFVLGAGRDCSVTNSDGVFQTTVNLNGGL